MGLLQRQEEIKKIWYMYVQELWDSAHKLLADSLTHMYQKLIPTSFCTTAEWIYPCIFLHYNWVSFEFNLFTLQLSEFIPSSFYTTIEWTLKFNPFILQSSELIPSSFYTTIEWALSLISINSITPNSGQMHPHFASSIYCDYCAFLDLELVITWGSQSKHN